jgi:alpha-L-fucosidase 2
VLKAAEIISANDDFLDVIRNQIRKLDPIIIGASGQVKEFREENGYGEIGDPHHRHVSHLCCLYPGTLINSQTPDWLRGASIALDYRGNNTTGWAMAHRMNLRARTKEAEKAYEVYSKFIKERTCPNLWTVHPPFQIDGSLGCMAGVTEMLVQSHEGCIELLPALPNAWSTGEFKGFVGRGNFEISTKWDKSKIYYLKIIARNGGTCKIKLKDVEDIQIKNCSGNDIPYKKASNGMVEFNTSKLKEYSVIFL